LSARFECRSFENQRYRASDLNLVVAAIVLWNTTYLERAVQSLKAHGHSIHESLLQHLSPMGWEHINLTGIMSGQQANAFRRRNSGRFDLIPWLNVLYNPFRGRSPLSTANAMTRPTRRPATAAIIWLP
jgi:hypothetical protein